MDTSTKILIGLGVVAVAGFCLTALCESNTKAETVNNYESDCEREAIFLKMVASRYHKAHAHRYGTKLDIDYVLLGEIIDSELKLINSQSSRNVQRPQIHAESEEATLFSLYNGIVSLTACDVA